MNGLKRLTVAVLALTVWTGWAEELTFAVLGDSYSTFEGEIPKGNACWYMKPPHNRNDVTSAKELWWNVLAEMTGLRRGTIEAYSGSTICNRGYDGADYTDRSFMTRVPRLGKCDIILVCGATNDSWAGVPIGEEKESDWTKEDLYTFRPAMCKLLVDLKATYPKAKIYFILNSLLREEINESVRKQCAKQGVGLIELNGIAKVKGHPSVDGMRRFAAQVANRLAADGLIGELGPAIRNPIPKLGTACKGKCAAYFVDDTIWCLRDLARQRPKSIFDQPYFRHLKEAHDRWGLKVQLNLFYRTDTFYSGKEFTLADMPVCYKAEFQSAKDWLRFGPHSIQEFPDYPFVNADYDDMKSFLELMRREIERFAGPGMMSKAMVAHWDSVSTEGCKAIADFGIKYIAATRGPRYAYDGKPERLPYGHSFRVENNRKPSTALYRRGGPAKEIDSSVCGHDHMTLEQAKVTDGTFKWWLDPETGLGVRELRNGPMLNRHSVAGVKSEMEKLLATQCDYACFGMHEQYFYPDYFNHQEDYVEKVFTASKLVHDAGYKFIFLDDVVEVDPQLGESAPEGSGPRLTAKELLTEHLDTSIPELAEVARLAECDVAAAERAFAAYLRKSLQPEKLNADWLSKTYTAKERETLQKEVDETMDYRFSAAHAGKHHFADHKIDWKINPTFNGYKEWTWQFSRMPFWTKLAEYYTLTKDEKAARCWMDQMNSWLDQAQVPLDDNPYRPCTWRTIEAGIRMSTWSRQLHAFIHSPELSDHFLTAVCRSLWEHGNRLQTATQGSGNWVIIEKSGQLELAFLFPFFKESKLWRTSALDRLTRELVEQFYPDGFQAELTTGYHGGVLSDYNHVMELFEKYDQTLPPEMSGVLERGYDVYARLMMPDGRTPDLNDGTKASVVSWLRKALRRFPQRQDWRWIVTNGREGRAPDYLSYVFPQSGAAVLRSGWDPKALWAYMDASPFGIGHQHEDKLNVILAAYGKTMLTEAGCYYYDNSETRRYVLSTRGHNTIRINGQDQNQRKTHRWEKGYITRPADCRWKFTDACEVVESSFTAGYGPDLDRTVHTRTLAFFKSPTCGLPPFFVVMDQLQAPDAKPRNYEVMWHLTNSKLTLDRLSFTAYFWDGVSLAAVFSDPEGKFVNRQGQKEPYFQGWLPIWKPGPHEQNAVPTPVAEGTFSGSRRLVTVFCPYTNGVNPIASVEASVDVADRSFVLTTAEGRRCELTIPNLNK